MKRQTYEVRLIRNGKTIAESEKHAFNSARRESERLVRDYARRRGCLMERGTCVRTDTDCREVWTGCGVVADAVETLILIPVETD